MFAMNTHSQLSDMGFSIKNQLNMNWLKECTLENHSL